MSSYRHLFRNFLVKSARMQRLPGFTFFILISPFLSAQQFGGNPPSLNWKQINTDTAKIIFPVGADSTAQRVASVVHFLAAKNNSLGSKLNKINIVLQNQTTIANAYVGNSTSRLHSAILILAVFPGQRVLRFMNTGMCNNSAILESG